MPIDDGEDTLSIEARPSPASDPVETLTIDHASVVVADPGETLTIDAPLVVAPTATDDPDHEDGPGEDAGGEGSTPSDHAGSGRSPADALAFLEAEVSALSERVDRIPDRRDDESAGPPNDHLDDRA